MSAGMAEVIAAHKLYDSRYAGTPWLRTAESASCSCGHEHGGWIDTGGEPCPDWDDEHAAHVAEELAKAGYGKLQTPAAEALTEAADRLLELGRWPGSSHPTAADRVTMAGPSTPDPLAAALADPEGHALVKATHDRKVGA